MKKKSSMTKIYHQFGGKVDTNNISRELHKILHKIDEGKKKADVDEVSSTSMLKKKRRDDLYCEKCDTYISYANFQKHLKKCQGTKKKKINLEVNLLKKEIDELKEKILQLKKENANLRLQISSGDETLEMEDLVKNKSHNTQLSYTSNWKKYEIWCFDNNKPCYNKKSAIDYYSYLLKPPFGSKKLKYSSISTARAVLLLGFKYIYKQEINFFLNSKKKRNIKPKYSMSEEEIFSFLTSFDNKQDFLAHFILIFSACRIHSLAMLKKKDCQDGVINLYDLKTDKEIPFTLQDSFINELLDHHLSNKSEEDFAFYPPYNVRSLQDLTKRSKYVSQLVKFKIKNSKVFQDIDKRNFSLTPHMFRKTKAKLEFDTIVKEGLKKARESINQSAKSNAIFKYVNIPKTCHIFETLMEKIAEAVKLKADSVKRNVFDVEMFYSDAGDHKNK